MAKYTTVYLPPDMPKCPKCDGFNFVPIIKDDKEYAKCVTCGRLIEASHYDVEVDECDGECQVNFDELKNNAKK